jgi:hypothetical protein
MSDSPLYADFADMLANPKTCTADIEAAGWKMEMNMGGNIFWRHEPTQSAYPMPQWAREWALKSAASAREALRKSMRDALGIG